MPLFPFGRRRYRTILAIAGWLGAAEITETLLHAENDVHALWGLNEDSQSTRLPDLATALSGRSGPLLFEGLPHPFHESALLQEELARTDVAKFLIADQPLYATPTKLAGNERTALDQIMRLPESVAPWRGPSLCCQFHADYLLRWPGPNSADAPVDVLVCFGCLELIIVAQDVATPTAIGPEAADQLWQILSPIRQHRPWSPGLKVHRKDETQLKFIGLPERRDWDNWVHDTGADTIEPPQVPAAPPTTSLASAMARLLDWSAWEPHK